MFDFVEDSEIPVICKISSELSVEIVVAAAGVDVAEYVDVEVALIVVSFSVAGNVELVNSEVNGGFVFISSEVDVTVSSKIVVLDVVDFSVDVVSVVDVGSVDFEDNVVDSVGCVEGNVDVDVFIASATVVFDNSVVGFVSSVDREVISLVVDVVVSGLLVPVVEVVAAGVELLVDMEVEGVLETVDVSVDNTVGDVDSVVNFSVDVSEAVTVSSDFSEDVGSVAFEVF